MRGEHVGGPVTAVSVPGSSTTAIQGDKGRPLPRKRQRSGVSIAWRECGPAWTRTKDLFLISDGPVLLYRV